MPRLSTSTTCVELQQTRASKQTFPRDLQVRKQSQKHVILEVSNHTTSLIKRENLIKLGTSSYKSLSPKTRALFGLGLMAWASIGLWTSPQVEGALGMVPSEEEKGELERKLAFRVERVER